jgi:hypothetical protein
MRSAFHPTSAEPALSGGPGMGSNGVEWGRVGSNGVETGGGVPPLSNLWDELGMELGMVTSKPFGILVGG